VQDNEKLRILVENLKQLNEYNEVEAKRVKRHLTKEMHNISE